MRQKAEFSQRPPEYTVENDSGTAVITFYEDITEIERGDDTLFTAITWTISVPYADSLPERVRVNKSMWLNKAKAEAYAVAAAAVRAARDKLLLDSDASMALDRMGLNIPENITATSLLSCVRSLFTVLRTAVTGSAALYRQALRDLPMQPGFPYDIDWPHMD